MSTIPTTESVERRVFSYLVAEKADLYRAIMAAFMAAKSRFALHLRPGEIDSVVGASLGPVDTASLEAALTQLCQWGNLEAHPDTSDVSTIEEFYRARHLYRMSPAGEAVERAVAEFRRILQQPGELKTAALGDITEQLRELLSFSAADVLDDAKVHRALTVLRDRFDELTSQAQRFIGSLQRAIDLQGIELQAFLKYKRTLIDYLERFIRELAITTVEVADLMGQIERGDVERLVQAAARRELADALDATDAVRERVIAQWQGRWAGLRHWFIRDSSGPSQAEALRALARSAIPNLLLAISGIHDRRISRTDRVTDLRTVALWFAQADSDAEAHLLWRGLFGLTPARHLQIDQETLDARDQAPVSPQTSWLDAPPIYIAPRLRTAGHVSRRGRSHSVIDRTDERRRLAQLAEDEGRQIAAAQAYLAQGLPVRLSQLRILEPREFQVFLDLLGQALAQKTHGAAPVEATSVDGSLRIMLEPTADGAEAIIRTTTGEFRGRDHIIMIHAISMVPEVIGGTE